MDRTDNTGIGFISGINRFYKNSIFDDSNKTCFIDLTNFYFCNFKILNGKMNEIRRT
jgi:hypothetical protein